MQQNRVLVSFCTKASCMLMRFMAWLADVVLME